jgi:putative sterol carrier protein
MEAVFPSQAWLDKLIKHINQDQKYAKIAANWEGDILFDLQPEGGLAEPMRLYIHLWHGKSEGGHVVPEGEDQPAAFVLGATYGNVVRILKGDLDPMQAMLTRKLKVEGSLPYMLRNVPTVLEFVRCAQDVTDAILPV